MGSGMYTIRTMRREEADLAVEWAASEGWNPGMDDAACFHAADPGGFFVGLLGDEPIAVISGVRYGASFGFIGLYIVKPEYRGKGYGLEIWKHAMEYLAERNIGLDGVVAQQENYRKSGFRLAYRNVRYEGESWGDAERYPDVVDLSEVPFEAVERYDRVLFPEERTAFLKAWLSQPGGTALGVVRDAALSGYGVVRACRSGYKIGPLFADSPEIAECLFVSLQSGIAPGEPIYLDVPEVNLEAVALAERHGMHVVFETARMYTGEFPDVPMERCFGVTSFELG